MSGSLGSQTNPLFVRMGDDSWAKDSTLQKILQSLPDKWKKAADVTEKQASATAANTVGLQASTNAQKAIPSEIRQKLASLGYEWKTVLTQGFSQGSGIFGSLGRSFKNLDLATEDSSKSIQVLSKTSLGLGIALSFLEKSFSKFFEFDKVFTDIYGSGVRLQGGINGLITSSSKAGMTVADFGALMTKNSTTVAAFSGRSVPSLIESFQKATSYGGDYIMSLQENAETFLQTAEIYQQAGIAGSMTNEQLVNSSRRFIGELTKTSEATGMSRKSLLDFVSSITKSGSSFLLLSTFSKQAGENFVNASTQLAKFGQQGGKLLSDNIQKYFAGGQTFGLLDESMLKLVATVPGLDSSFRNLAEASVQGGEVAEQAQKDFAKTLIAAPVSLRRQLLAAMPELAGTLGDLIQNAERVQKAEQDRLDQMKKEAAARNVDISVIEREYKERDKQDQARKASVEKFNATVNELNNEIYRVYAGLADILTPLLSGLTVGLRTVIDVFTGVDQKIGKLFGLGGAEGRTGVLGALATAGAAYGLYRGGRAMVGRFRTPSIAPGIPGMDKGLTPSNPLFVSLVGGMPGSSPLIPGMGGAQGSPGTPGRAGGRFGRLAGMLGRGSIGGLVAGAALGGAGALATGAGYTKTGAGIDILGQAAGLAGTGAMLGSFLGPGGTLVGGALGGLAGAGMGLYQNWGTLFGQQGGEADRSPEQAAGQLSLLEQIDQMLEDRQGLNLQYTETGQALRDFSSGYREVISALSLSAPGGIDNAQRLLSLIGQQREGSVAPAEYQSANENWQNDVMITWKAIRELNENMVSLLTSMAGNLDSMVSDRPVQGAGMLPG